MRPLTSVTSCLALSLIFLSGCQARKTEGPPLARETGPKAEARAEMVGAGAEVEFKGRARIQRYSALVWFDVELPEVHRDGEDSIDIKASWSMYRGEYLPKAKGAVLFFDSSSRKARFKGGPELMVEIDEGRYSLGRMKRGVFRRVGGHVRESASVNLEHQLYERIFSSKKVTFMVGSIVIPMSETQREIMLDLSRAIDVEAARS